MKQITFSTKPFSNSNPVRPHDRIVEFLEALKNLEGVYD